MADKSQVRGSIPAFIRNDENLYQGDLVHYFQIVFYEAQNLHHPYHNFRHMTHVAWLCYDACHFHTADLSPRQMRNLLIAALFHDFDHRGKFGEDDLNIELAVRGLRKHILPMDVHDLGAIEQLIRATEYPHKIPTENLDLCGLILCDADVSQAFSVAWIQQVVFGLAGEWGKPPLEVLKMQMPFLTALRFNSPWAKARFPLEDINAKIQETRELFEILDTKKTEAA